MLQTDETLLSEKRESKALFQHVLIATDTVNPKHVKAAETRISNLHLFMSISDNPIQCVTWRKWHGSLKNLSSIDNLGITRQLILVISFDFQFEKVSLGTFRQMKIWRLPLIAAGDINNAKAVAREPCANGRFEFVFGHLESQSHRSATE